LLDRRTSLILAATALAGLVVGAAAWTLAGGAVSAEKAVTEAKTLFPTVRARRATSGSAAENIRQAMNSPLFGPLGGRGGVADPTIRLQGIARAPGRVAALLAIDAKPSAWLGLGETRDGVTLVEVSGSRISVETMIGEREIRLGGVAEPAGGASRAPLHAGQDEPPPGFRMPPPPASAPGMSPS
jgi:hypothetical protein